MFFFGKYITRSSQHQPLLLVKLVEEEREGGGEGQQELDGAERTDLEDTEMAIKQAMQVSCSNSFSWFTHLNCYLPTVSNPPTHLLTYLPTNTPTQLPEFCIILG